MDSRTAAHVLNSDRRPARAHRRPPIQRHAHIKEAARSVLALGADDLTPLLKSGELAKTRNVGPATLSVIRELIETGESSYLERLTADTPRGLIQMARVPGLGLAKVRLIHSELGVENLEELEQAARDGRLAKLPRLRSREPLNEFSRELRSLAIQDAGRSTIAAFAQAVVLREGVARHPDVSEAIIAGTVRRHHETIGDIAIVAVCSADPVEVARSFAQCARSKRSDRE